MQTSLRPPETWTDYSYLRWKGIDKPSSRLGKIKLEKFLKENSIKRLKIIKIFDNLSDINFDNMPDFFVLKPSALWSGKGVMLLHKIAGIDFYYDAKSGTVLSFQQIINIQRNVAASAAAPQKYIIEERAFDEDPNVMIPFDYKVFTFYGITKFILQIDRNHLKPRIAFFDGEFKPIEDDRVVVPESRADTIGVHRIPKHRDEILELAKDISIKLKAPFVSVDCYSTDKGALLGELTHTPGGPWYGSMYRFSHDFDLELGRAWAEANKKLGIAAPLIEFPYQIKLKNKVYRVVN